MADPIWQTYYELGTYSPETVIDTMLVATPIPPAVGMTYSISAGIIPEGLILTTEGRLIGTLAGTTDNQYVFTVTATDNLGNFSWRSFVLNLVVVPQQPTWNTPSGSIGNFLANTLSEFQFSASAVLPATSVRYALLSGSLPNGFTLTNTGLLYGTSDYVAKETTYNFAIRVTDNLNNIRDRFFSLTISGTASPTFNTPSGSILNTIDSVWVYLPISYTNPITTNEVVISLKEGALPPGLEINDKGIIRGYPSQPTELVTYPTVTTSVTETNSNNNILTCLSTLNFSIGRQVVFSGTTFGGLDEGYTYYIKTIESSTTFTISATQNGDTVILSNATGFMNTILPSVTAGQPTIRTYYFVLGLQSINGNDSKSYSITVVNQNTPVSQNGPGYPPNTRIPVIFNTQPPSYHIPPTDPYYGYYLPVTNSTAPVDIGTYLSGNYFAFKVIGYDFDGNNIKYSFSNLPLGLTGNVNTGWIYGTPILNVKTLNVYDFSVAVYKENNTSITSTYFNFSMKVSNDVSGVVTWTSPNDLGKINNGTLSTLYVRATSDVDLSYRIVSGQLPPNLTMLDNGEITGYVAFQPADYLLNQGDEVTFNFTVQAYSKDYPAVSSTMTFTTTVVEEFAEPTDTLYIKCTPSVEDRLKIQSLLTDNKLIPTNMLYRSNDINFGKATSVIYEHAYGIYASQLPQYIEAVTKNHYWRNITLGELRTAEAKNEAGEVIYEVVYSLVIDNLIKPTYEVVNSTFLVTGQTYTIVYPGTTDFTKVGAANSKAGTVFVATGTTSGDGTASLVTNTTSISSEIYWPRPIDLFLGPWYTSSTSIFTSYVELQNQLYYTSLTPGYARTLYPNSLPNMRNRVGEVLGQDYNSRLLPLWMTSQQQNGSTTGYIPAWVICYTKPGFSETIKNNIDTLWPYKLNEINFKIDRFSVDKSMTYNFNNTFTPPAWTSLPSADPVPTPIDSKDFYVLFPRQTILPDNTQY